MPFVSEELWQRLPKRRLHLDVPSLCVADYPEFEDYKMHRNEELDNKFER